MKQDRGSHFTMKFCIYMKIRWIFRSFHCPAEKNLHRRIKWFISRRCKPSCNPTAFWGKGRRPLLERDNRNPLGVGALAPSAVNGPRVGWFILRSNCVHAPLGRWGLGGGTSSPVLTLNTGWHVEPTCIIQLTIESSTGVSISLEKRRLWQMLLKMI